MTNSNSCANLEMYDTGIIGVSGRFYKCNLTEHIQTSLKYKFDAPFVCCYSDGVTFDAYYTSSKTKPTIAQYETVIDWCTKYGYLFEDVTDCWNKPWSDYL